MGVEQSYSSRSGYEDQYPLMQGMAATPMYPQGGYTVQPGPVFAAPQWAGGAAGGMAGGMAGTQAMATQAMATQAMPPGTSYAAQSQFTVY